MYRVNDTYNFSSDTATMFIIKLPSRSKFHAMMEMRMSS